MTHPAKEPSGFLGISGNSLHAPAPPTEHAVFKAKGQARIYGLLRQAQVLLYDRDAEPRAQHQTCWCQRSISTLGGLSVRRKRDGSGASLGGVTTCGSVWTCPVCSIKVCARRQKEVAAGMAAHIAAGGHVFLMTHTFPHEAGGMELRDMLLRLAAARQKFQNSRTYKRVLAKGIRTGTITSLEVTLGVHGWHPHAHVLVFAKPDAFGATRESDDGRLMSRAIDELKEAWYTALRKAGLCDTAQMSDVLAHGLDVRGGQYAAEYVAKFGRDMKWGLSRELTMHAAKTGGGPKGAHPFQLLEWSMNGDALAGDQFREYAAAFKGRRMLSWSPGLKAELGLDEREESDEELAAAQLPEEEVIGTITAEDLSVLTARNMVGWFFAFISEFCYRPETWQADIDDAIRYARELPRTASGMLNGRYFSARERKIYDPEKEANEQRNAA
ncbi:protein rep [Burkholderia stagnalis]|uniref:protein rep n=1 Tax=Burkholderia stagnalis TaxID=1503054 RepID=UPI000ACA080F|nr:protein rep [Burkholderia stagnalis]